MLTIKSATENDIPLIIDLTMKTWPQTYTPIIGEEQVAYMLGKFYTPGSLLAQMNGGHQFIIGYNGRSAVAFASFSKLEGTTFKLHKIYLLPGVQGNGIGKLLLDHIISAIVHSGATSLRLNVNRYNSRAIAFYKKTGFFLVREEDIDIGSGYFMNDFVLELPLPAIQ